MEKNNLKQKSLLVVIDHHLLSNGTSYYSSNSLFFKFLNQFKPYFKNIAISSPVVRQKTINTKENYEFKEDIEVLPRPAYKRLFLYYALLPFYSLLNFLKMISYFRKFDIIWIVTPGASQLVAYFVARILKKSYFIYIIGNIRSIHQGGCPIHQGGFLSFFKNTFAAIEHLINRYITRNTLVFSLGKEILDLHLQKSNRCVLVATNLIEDEEILSMQAWRKIHAAKEPIRLLSVTRLSQEKGLELGIDIALYLQEKGYKVQYVIAGKGPYESNLKGYIQEKKMGSVVSFAGFIQDKKLILDLYRKSDFFLLTSISEGIPKTLFEAQASGSVVLSTRVGGAPEVVENGETGFIFDSRSVPAFGDKIIDLIQKPAKRIKIVQNGFEKSKASSAPKQAEKITGEIIDYFDFD